MTLVEDASHVSITADIETASTTVNVGVQCAINGGAETCSDVFVIDALSTTTQLLVMGTAAFTGVPIAPSAASASSSDQGTVTVPISIASDFVSLTTSTSSIETSSATATASPVTSSSGTSLTSSVSSASLASSPSSPSSTSYAAHALSLPYTGSVLTFIGLIVVVF